MDCLHCNKHLEAGKKEGALYCNSACKQAAYRLRVKARAAAELWQSGETAIANNYIVTIGPTNHQYAAVRMQYALARVPDDKAAVWHRVPKSKLKRLEALGH